MVLRKEEIKAFKLTVETLAKIHYNNFDVDIDKAIETITSILKEEN